MGVESEGACSADSRSSALLDPATKARPPDSNAQAPKETVLRNARGPHPGVVGDIISMARLKVA